jgi:hypothetical protein
MNINKDKGSNNMLKPLFKVYNRNNNVENSQEILAEIVNNATDYIKEKFGIRDISFEDSISLSGRYHKLYATERALEIIASAYNIPINMVGLTQVDNETGQPVSLALSFQETPKKDSTGMPVGGFYRPADHSITILDSGVLFHEWVHAMRYATGIHYDTKVDDAIWAHDNLDLSNPLERAYFVQSSFEFHSARVYFAVNSSLQNRFENSLSSLSDEQKHEIEDKVREATDTLISFFSNSKNANMAEDIKKYAKAFDSKKLKPFMARHIFKDNWKEILEAYKVLHEYAPGFRLEYVDKPCVALTLDSDFHILNKMALGANPHIVNISEFYRNNMIRDLFDHKGIVYFGSYEEMAAYGASAAFKEELTSSKLIDEHVMDETGKAFGMHLLIGPGEETGEAFNAGNRCVRVMGKEFTFNEKPQSKQNILRLKKTLTNSLHHHLENLYSTEMHYTPSNPEADGRTLFGVDSLFPELKRDFGFNNVDCDIFFASKYMFISDINTTFKDTVNCITQNMGLPKDIFKDIAGKPLNISFINDCQPAFGTKSANDAPDIFYNAIDHELAIKPSKFKESGDFGKVMGYVLAKNIPDEQKRELLYAIKYETVSGEKFTEKAQNAIKMFYDSTINVLDAFCKANSSEIDPKFRDTIEKDIRDIFTAMYTKQTPGYDVMKFIDNDIIDDKTIDLRQELINEGCSAEQIRLTEDIKRLCVYPSVGNTMSNIITKYINNAAQTLTDYNGAVNRGKNSGKVFSDIYLSALKADYDNIDIELATCGDAIVSYEKRLFEFQEESLGPNLIGTAIGDVIADSVKHEERGDIKQIIGGNSDRISSDLKNTIMNVLSETYSREGNYDLSQDDIDIEQE